MKTKIGVLTQTVKNRVKTKADTPWSQPVDDYEKVKSQLPCSGVLFMMESTKASICALKVS